jgi:hypothetical protein
VLPDFVLGVWVSLLDYLLFVVHLHASASKHGVRLERWFAQAKAVLGKFVPITMTPEGVVSFLEALLGSSRLFPFLISIFG